MTGEWRGGKEGSEQRAPRRNCGVYYGGLGESVFHGNEIASANKWIIPGRAKIFRNLAMVIKKFVDGFGKSYRNRKPINNDRV